MEISTITGILDTTLAVIFTWIAYKTGSIIYKYTPYSYPNARIRAMEARLFTEQRFNELAESKDLNTFVMNLEDSDYKPYLSKLSIYTAETIDRAFDEALADTYRLMFKILPKRINPFFKLLLEEWDIRNISAIVKAKVYGEVARDYIAELGTMVEKIKAMAEAKTLEEILVILEGTEYEEVYQRLLLKEITIEEFETELYKMHYAKLLKYAESRKDEERKILEEFVKLKIDKINLMTILRAKLYGLGADKIKPFLIPGGSLSQRVLDTLMHVEDLSMALAELDSTKYNEVLREVREGLESGDLDVFNKAFERYIKRKISKLTRFYPLSVAIPLNYILAKESEIRKLKAIAKLIEDRIKPEDIKALVGELP
ncbi:V-type ATP synthase subunit C [Thermococcus barophilus]|uniref:A-type ATP synthase subunit C n=1 Tax=Thermococcus barophilus TaxID=55802 RepID=A0A0S1XDA5_THEBA|nr:V-type ATP synthase subunit C [Thermococcus barophilus]ALM75771.1 sodium ion-dependent V-type ATP synthase subunit G [Thermococcus barophilus]